MRWFRALPALAPVQLAGDRVGDPPCAPHQTQRCAPGGDYWPAPRLDAGTYFGLINARLRQSYRLWLPPQLICSLWRQRPVQRLFRAGAADGWANCGACCCRRWLAVMTGASFCCLLLGAAADCLCGFIWLPQHFLSGFGPSPVAGLGGAFPVPGAGSSITPGNRRVAGRLVALAQGIGFIIAGLSPLLSGLLLVA